MARANTSQAKPQTRTATVSATESDVVEGIRVLSLTQSFHRAGFRFTREGVELRLSDLTEEQVEAIAAEPMLSVRRIELPAEPDCRNATDESTDGAKDSANINANDAGNA